MSSIGSIEQVYNIYRNGRIGEFHKAAENVIALAMTGLSVTETAELARSVAASGQIIELPVDLGPFADVPSTGAPGSLSTVLCPFLIAAIGVRVPKISASGSIAGAIDVFQTIQGFQASLDESRFIQALRTAGIAHSLPTSDYCPADNSLIEARRRRGAMDNRFLATASLLAKKLAVPGTAAVFDFRMGTTGNLGSTLADIQSAAFYFLEVAKILGINCAVCVTDNRSLPCTALGRLESLQLLSDVLAGRSLSSRDAEHLDMCVQLAAHAVAIATGTSDVHLVADSINSALRSGKAWKVLIQHLESQGAGKDSLEEALAIRESQLKITIEASGDGYWIEPDLVRLKSWFKTKQSILDPMGTCRAELQLGLRAQAFSGEYVKSGDPVLEVRAPRGFELQHDEMEWLIGSLSLEPVEGNAGLLKAMTF